MLGVQVIISLDLYHIKYMAIATIICIYVLLGFNLWETTQRDLLRAIPKIHGYMGWCTYHSSSCRYTTVYPVQERNTSSTIITIGHIDECHYVSTTALQSSASISMCNELTNDTQSSINKHFIMSVYNTGWHFLQCKTTIHDHKDLFQKCLMSVIISNSQCFRKK